MSEVATHLLNYNDKKRRGVSSRAYRSVIPSSNGTTFVCGNTINIDFAGNNPNTYYDFQNSYLQFTITNNDGAAIKLEGGVGGYGLIRKIEAVVSGQTLFSIDNYSTLLDYFMDSEVNSNFKNTTGAIQFATNSLKFSGTPIASNASKKVCLPLVLTPLYQSSKLIPGFSRDSIRLKITLDNAQTATIGAAADNEITISDVQMVMYNVELSDEAQSMVMASNQGRFEIVVDDFRHSQLTVAQNVTSLNGVVGFSFSSLNRVIILHRPQGTATTGNVVSIGNRATADLQEISITLNGMQYPQRLIKEGGANPHGSEVLSESLIADRSNGIFTHQSGFNVVSFNLQNPSGTTDALCGTYGVVIDTEALRTSDSDRLYSGLNTIGQVIAIQATYETVPAAMLVDCYGQFTMSILLDMSPSGTGTFTVAI
jgi:hypothetical protein